MVAQHLSSQDVYSLQMTSVLTAKRLLLLGRTCSSEVRFNSRYGKNQRQRLLHEAILDMSSVPFPEYVAPPTQGTCVLLAPTGVFQRNNQNPFFGTRVIKCLYEQKGYTVHVEEFAPPEVFSEQALHFKTPLFDTGSNLLARIKAAGVKDRYRRGPLLRMGGAMLSEAYIYPLTSKCPLCGKEFKTGLDLHLRDKHDHIVEKEPTPHPTLEAFHYDLVCQRMEEFDLVVDLVFPSSHVRSLNRLFGKENRKYKNCHVSPGGRMPLMRPVFNQLEKGQKLPKNTTQRVLSAEYLQLKQMKWDLKPLFQVLKLQRRVFIWRQQLIRIQSGPSQVKMLRRVANEFQMLGQKVAELQRSSFQESVSVSLMWNIRVFMEKFGFVAVKDHSLKKERRLELERIWGPDDKEARKRWNELVKAHASEILARK
jgi:hypothetical protein